MSIDFPQKIIMFFQGRLGLLLINLALASLLAWQLAQWTGVVFKAAPKTLHSSVQVFDPQTMAEQIGAQKVFGLAVETPVAQQSQVVTPLNLKLIGVFAAAGALPAVAIIKVDNKEGAAFATGDAVLPDVSLAQVLPDHVVLNRAGVMEKLMLESSGAVLDIPITSGTPKMPAAEFVPPPPPDANRQPVVVPGHLSIVREDADRYSINKAELVKGLSHPDELAHVGKMVAVPGQGLRVEELEAGYLLRRLGFQEGDVITRTSGSQVANQAEFLRKLSAGGQIKVEGVRDGQPFTNTYAVR